MPLVTCWLLGDTIEALVGLGKFCPSVIQMLWLHMFARKTIKVTSKLRAILRANMDELYHANVYQYTRLTLNDADFFIMMQKNAGNELTL